MARINNLTNFLNDVAAAIKEKLGDSTNIPAAQFDTKIREIETGGDYQSKTINISANGSQTITPDSEYDALSSVVINVQVPVKQLQSKTYEFTDNTHIVLSPETGYDGFSSIELTINVPQEGGSGDIKLFKTVEEMQADPNPSEGDLAVVYRSEIQPCTATAHFSKAIFPETVVLDSALEDSVELRFRPVDDSQMFYCWGQLDSNYFQMDCYGEEGEYRIRYESQDGITYTRTRLQDPNGNVTGNELDFGVEIYYEYEEMWNDVIGKFINIGGKYFEGLYQYKFNSDKENIALMSISGIDFDIDGNYPVNGKYNGEVVASVTPNEILTMVNTLKKIVSLDSEEYIALWSDISDNICVGILYKDDTRYSINYGNPIYSNTDKNYLGIFPGNTGVNELQLDIYHFNNDYSETSLYKTVTGTAFDGSMQYFDNTKVEAKSFPIRILIDRSGITVKYGIDTIYYIFSGGASSTSVSIPMYKDAYVVAPTQLTLNNASQLPPDILGYGKNGVITGDGSLYENLDPAQVLQKVMTMDIATGQSIEVYGELNTNIIGPGFATGLKPRSIKAL